MYSVNIYGAYTICKFFRHYKGYKDECSWDVYNLQEEMKETLIATMLGHMR